MLFFFKYIHTNGFVFGPFYQAITLKNADLFIALYHNLC